MKTGECLVCGGDIVHSPGRDQDTKPPFGADNSIHCSRCGIRFAFPTPAAVSDQMKRARSMVAANSVLLGEMMDH